MAGSGVNEIIAPSFFFCLEKQKSNKKATTNKTYLVTILKTICPLFFDVLFPQEVASMAIGIQTAEKNVAIISEK